MKQDVFFEHRATIDAAPKMVQQTFRRLQRTARALSRAEVICHPTGLLSAEELDAPNLARVRCISPSQADPARLSGWSVDVDDTMDLCAVLTLGLRSVLIEGHGNMRINGSHPFAHLIREILYDCGLDLPPLEEVADARYRH